VSPGDIPRKVSFPMVWMHPSDILRCAIQLQPFFFAVFLGAPSGSFIPLLACSHSSTSTPCFKERAILEMECETLKRELGQDLTAIRHRIGVIDRILGEREDAGSALRGAV
jgi:hypothetical protein